MPAETVRDMCKSPRRARHVHEGSEIRTGLDRHAHECRFAQRVTQSPDEISQPSCVKWSRYDRAPPGASAGNIAIGVANTIAVFELECGVLREEGDHPGCGFEKRIDLGFVEIVAKHIAQIGARQLRVFDNPGTPRQLISRRPHPAARPCSRSAEHWFLFGNDDLEAMKGGGDRGRQAAGP